MSSKLKVEELITLVMAERNDGQFDADFEASSSTGEQYADKFASDMLSIIAAGRADRAKAKIPA